jgi:phosphoglycerate-specific signal transduction histidine kinase
MAKALACLRGDSPNCESEHRIRTKAGTWCWVSTRGMLVNLTRQLLASARNRTVLPKELDLNEIATKSLAMLQLLIGENLQINWLPCANLWSLKMDPFQIDQILTNLVINACDAIVGVGKITIETNNRVMDESYCAKHVGAFPGDYVRRILCAIHPPAAIQKIPDYLGLQLQHRLPSKPPPVSSSVLGQDSDEFLN